jgi:hypothetical protein
MQTMETMKSAYRDDLEQAQETIGRQGLRIAELEEALADAKRRPAAASQARSSVLSVAAPIGAVLLALGVLAGLWQQSRRLDAQVAAERAAAYGDMAHPITSSASTTVGSF